MSSPAAPRPRRNTALVVVDIVVSVAVLLFALVFGLVSLLFVQQITTFSATCAPACNGTLLSVAAYLLLGVTVVVFLLGVGFAIIRIIQRRYTTPWTIGALVIMVVTYYLSTFLVGQAAV